MKNYLMMLLLLLTIGASAAPIDRDAALKSAQSFFLKRGAKKPTKMSLVYKGRAPHAAKGRGVSAKNASYYIFNNDENGGFVIVSGDDRTPTILGYSDDGNIDADNIPDNMAEWLNGYAEQIEYLDEAGMEKLQVMRKVPTMRAIIPMLKSRWTQDEPFCNLLPEISGTHLPVGCGATAMAQLMYYHKWPDATQAEIPGYKNIYQYTGYDEIILDTIPANSPLDWENMLDVYNGKETEEQNNAVATLSKYCGVALEMNYRLGGSSSSLSDYPRVLSTYFGYDSKIKYVKRDNYSYDAWTQLMYSELLAGRPIAYGGQSSGGGHAFIIDGYDGEELFHINWGWNNGTDGYFLLSVANDLQNGVSMMGGLLAEIIFTCVFVLVVLGATAKTNGATNNFAGLAIGLSLILIHLACIRYTGTSVNPARSLAPAFFQGGTALSNLWIFIVGPFVGAAIAAGIWKVIDTENE